MKNMYENFSELGSKKVCIEVSQHKPVQKITLRLVLFFTIVCGIQVHDLHSAGFFSKIGSKLTSAAKSVGRSIGRVGTAIKTRVGTAASKAEASLTQAQRALTKADTAFTKARTALTKAETAAGSGV